MAIVADSSFLIALLNGEKWAEGLWKRVKEGERMYVSTVSLAVASMNLLKEGKEMQVDLLVAALKQALNVSIALLDVKIALDAGRFMYSLGGDFEGGVVVATALLKKCEVIATKRRELADVAKKYGMSVVTAS